MVPVQLLLLQACMVLENIEVVFGYVTLVIVAFIYHLLTFTAMLLTILNCKPIRQDLFVILITFETDRFLKSH